MNNYVRLDNIGEEIVDFYASNDWKRHIAHGGDESLDSILLFMAEQACDTDAYDLEDWFQSGDSISDYYMDITHKQGLVSDFEVNTALHMQEAQISYIYEDLIFNIDLIIKSVVHAFAEEMELNEKYFQEFENLGIKLAEESPYQYRVALYEIKTMVENLARELN